MALQPRQLNLFIGKPNTGKSNILEAISLLGAGYSKAERFMSEFIRYEEPTQMFKDGVPNQPIVISTNIGMVKMWPHATPDSAGFAIGPFQGFVDFSERHGPELTMHKYAGERGGNAEDIIRNSKVPIINGVVSLNDARLSTSRRYPQSIVRKYTFRPEAFHALQEFGHLSVPHGENLFQVMKASKPLRQAAAALFEPNGHQFVLRMANNTLETQKNIDGDVYSYPWSSIADTFQRLVFYLAAIESNEGAVLLFEEPEVSSFPPYVTDLAERIAEDVEAKRNQYFITTHSPYLITKLLEKTGIGNAAVFLVDYEAYHTTVRPLTEAEIEHLLESGSSMFWNLPDPALPIADGQ